MIAIIYPRVSTEEQAREGYSLAAQREACRNRAIALGYRESDIVEICEEGVSGDILERPGLTKVRELVRRGGVGHFICLDPDRFSRKLTYALLVADEMERAGVVLEFINFEWKSTPEGRLFYSLRGAIAEFEKEKIKERSMRGKRQKAKEGKLTHNPRAYGYVFDKEADTLSPHPVEAEWVRQMYQWCAMEHAGPHTVAKRLNAYGVPGPRGSSWLKATVSRILRNPTYRGELILQRYNTIGVKGNKYRKESDRVQQRIHPEENWVRVAVPALVDPAIWEKAQDSLAETRRIKPGTAVADYLLSGLCTCGDCGSTIHGFLARSHGKTRTYYVCTRRNPGLAGHDKCSMPYLPSLKLENFIWSQVKDWVLNPEKLVMVLEQQQQTPPVQKADIAPIERQLEEVRQEQARLLNLYQKGIGPLEEIEGRLAEVAKREQKLMVVHASLSSIPDPTPLPRLSDVESVLAKLRPLLESDTFQNRRTVVLRIVKRVYVHQGSFHIVAQI